MNLPLNVDFSGKVVVITGAGGVLCGTMARAFAQVGAKVAALDLNEEAVKKLADECKAEGYICEGYKANVLEHEALEEVHARILDELRSCDILVNRNCSRCCKLNKYKPDYWNNANNLFWFALLQTK